MISFGEIVEGIYIFRPDGCPYNIISFYGTVVYHDVKNHTIVNIFGTNGGETKEGEYFKCDEHYDFNISLLEDEPTVEVLVNCKGGGGRHASEYERIILIQHYNEKSYRVYCPQFQVISGGPDRPIHPQTHMGKAAR